MAAPLACLFINKRGGCQTQLEESLLRNGIDVSVRMEPLFSWRRSTLWWEEMAKTNPNRLLLLLDAWDTLMVGTLAELYELDPEHGITLAAGKICWPDPQLAGNFDHELSPWRYVNVNPIVGLGRNIAGAISWGWSRFPIEGYNNTFNPTIGADMRFWTRLFLEAKDIFDMRLDTRCEMCQVLMGCKEGELWTTKDKRIVNRIHNTKAVFVHANGGRPMPEELL